MLCVGNALSLLAMARVTIGARTLAARLDLVQRRNASWNIVTCDDVCKEQVGENDPSILQSCIDGCKIPDDDDVDDYCRWFTGHDGAMNTMSDETAQACRKGAEAMRELAIHEVDDATYVKQPEASSSDLVKAAGMALKSVVMKDFSKNFKLTDVRREPASTTSAHAHCARSM